VTAVLHRAGEGEALFDGRIVIKADFEQICITESSFPCARPGADPHFHRQHADSFYVLDGELAVHVCDREHRLDRGACVCFPAGVVHGFRSTAAARFLNLHTPAGGFAGNLRALQRGEPGGFDSIDAPAGSGLPASNAILLAAGKGERRAAVGSVTTTKIDREELSVAELELQPGIAWTVPRADGGITAFYVLQGEAELRLGHGPLALDPGSFVALSPGAAHALAGGPAGSRLLVMRSPGRVVRSIPPRPA
jgi:quercetin dioxygenase-like cupin family protein